MVRNYLRSGAGPGFLSARNGSRPGLAGWLAQSSGSTSLTGPNLSIMEFSP
jgi:hypothetical protein